MDLSVTFSSKGFYVHTIKWVMKLWGLQCITCGHALHELCLMEIDLNMEILRFGKNGDIFHNCPRFLACFVFYGIHLTYGVV